MQSPMIHLNCLAPVGKAWAKEVGFPTDMKPDKGKMMRGMMPACRH